MKLPKAKLENYGEVMSFYYDLIDNSPDMEKFARWKKGQHPTESGVMKYIEDGNMYLYEENGEIVGAMAITMYQDESYHPIDWCIDAADSEVAVIHILGVNPRYQGKGIATGMIREAIAMAAKNGMKAVRLDALSSNTPAHKIYQKIGFELRGKQNLYAENTGWTDFLFFEYMG